MALDKSASDFEKKVCKKITKKKGSRKMKKRIRKALGKRLSKYCVDRLRMYNEGRVNLPL